LIVRGLLVCGVLLLGGCGWLGWFGKSDEQLTLETGSSAPTEIPVSLDKPPFNDQMPIPQVVDYRGLADKEIELRLPDALSTSFGVEQIVIRKLGESRWVFLDLPTATIWPQVVLFWEENHLPVEQLDPRNGTLETAWIIGTSGNPDEIYESLTTGSAWGEQSMAQQYKFFVRVEPGVRASSTELYIEQAERPLGGFDPDDRTDWDGQSDNPELEGKMLTTLAYYLGDRVAQGPSVSLLAAGLQESKAFLVAEPEGMVLKYKLDFDRAWATVGAALEDARIDVEDLDRTSAIYYVYYSSRHDPDPGFFSKIFGGGDGKEDADPGHRFTVQLESEGEEIRVTVGVASELAASETDSLILKERLLKLIKEYST
jgi:outer membrane protein assembly factor BamC|tara:strand:+ start:4 stop:1116 length:1113 start_codon:yes stop_codon:yes gene_type:complete